MTIIVVETLENKKIKYLLNNEKPLPTKNLVRNNEQYQKTQKYKGLIW